MPTEQSQLPSKAQRVWLLLQDYVEENSRKRDLTDALGFRFGAGRGKVLFRLRGGPMTLGDLARAEGFDAPYATVIVDKLASLGYVERQPHPDDHRRKLVALTAAGRRAVAMADKMLSTPPPSMKSLTLNELLTLEILLKRLEVSNRTN